MTLTFWDILFFSGFIAMVVALAIYKGRREQDSEDYFLASRSLTWPLIGLSIVAANISTEQMVGMAGQGAGSIGLAVCSWQLISSVAIIIIAFTLLPRFLRAGIYTMPEYLEYRYHPAARVIMAFYTMVVYVCVTSTAVLYSGGLTLSTIFDLDLTVAVWSIGGIAALYTVWGGLKSVVWADLFLGSALIAGGLMTMCFGFSACGGVTEFFATNADKLHLILPAENKELPWTAVLAGMWIPIVYYCGFNQFIVQRTLAAKSLKQGQLGIVFTAALWLLVPLAIVLPGIMAHQLYGDQLDTTDQAFPMLISNLIPEGIRGFLLAAITGAVISSLASMLNSASTIFTMDLYRRMLTPNASQRQLVWTGRVVTLLFVIVGCLIAPTLGHPRFKGIFNFIQEFQGYISPGVLAAFLVGFVVKRAPAAAGITAILISAPIYGVLHLLFGSHSGAIFEVHFLMRMMWTFLAVTAVMLAITIVSPRSEPASIPVRKDFDITPSTLAMALGLLVILAVVAFYVVFW